MNKLTKIDIRYIIIEKLGFKKKSSKIQDQPSAHRERSVNVNALGKTNKPMLCCKPDPCYQG